MNSSKSSNSDAPANGPHQFTVQDQDAGGRLDKLLGGQPAVASREMARRLIEGGAVRVNGNPCSPSTRMRPGDVVVFRIPPPAPYGVAAEPGELKILHEDDWLVVVDKPAGVTVHPGPGHPGGTLVNLLLYHCSSLSGVGGVRRPGIVHRLDKDTSGVLVVAKNDEAHVHLARQFKAHTIGRTYFALVIGQPPRQKGKIELPLGRHPKQRMKRAVQQDGKRAVTHWHVEKRLPPFCLLRVNLETGRTHQIRVHLQEQGWPVVGDPLYGRARHRGLDLAVPLREALDRFGRQALHAAELQFVHPRTGETRRFTSPLPADMAALMNAVEDSAGV